MNEGLFLLLDIVIAAGISFLINHIQKNAFKTSCKKKLYLVLIELSVLLFFIGISVITIILLYGETFFDILNVIYLFLLIYSVYNIFRIIVLDNKKRYIKQIIFSLILFLAVNIVLSLFVSLYFWNTREAELIRITSLTEYTFLYVYIRVNFYLCVISFIIVQLINLIKSLKINKYIFLRLIPLKIIFICLFLLFTNGWDEICIWDILSDTWYSDNFNIYNIEKVEIGMEKEKVIELIGDPLHIYNDDEYSWTNDGKNFEQDSSRLFMRKDFAWFVYRVFFRDNKAYEIQSFWAHD
jgi:hypothetical protein